MDSATLKGATSVIDTSKGGEDCKEFVPGFLECLEPPLRKKYLQTLHGTIKNLIDNPVEECRNVSNQINAIRDKNPSAHFVLVRELARALNTNQAHNSAIELAKRQLIGDLPSNPKNYWIYLLLGQLYSETGSYAEAKEMHEKAKDATEAEEVLKRAVATVKLAIDFWHHESAALGRKYQNEALMLLKEVEPNLNSLRDPNSEEAILFTVAYKTFAYMFKVQHKTDQSIDCFKKVLKIVNLSPEAFLHASKINASLAGALIFKKGGKYLAKVHVTKARDFILQITEDQTFMQNHAAGPIHVLSKIAFCFQKLGSLQESLDARLEVLELSKTYFGETHPEVARTASDVALVHYMMGNMKNMNDYIELTENTLEDCGYENDMLKKKLYVKELSDALWMLGEIFTKLSFYKRAEMNYQLCLDLNIMVLMEDHPKVARVLEKMGNMYLQWERFSEAKEAYNKCLKIHESRPTESSHVYIISKIKKDLVQVEEAEKKKRPQRY